MKQKLLFFSMKTSAEYWVWGILSSESWMCFNNGDLILCFVRKFKRHLYWTIMDRFMCFYELKTLDCTVWNKQQLVPITCGLNWTGHVRNMTEGTTKKKTHWIKEGEKNKLSTHLTNSLFHMNLALCHTSRPTGNYNLTGFSWDFSTLWHITEQLTGTKVAPQAKLIGATAPRTKELCNRLTMLNAFL